jgi:hypothetical protein
MMQQAVTDPAMLAQMQQQATSPRRCSHLCAALYISLVVHHSKYTGARDNDFTAGGCRPPPTLTPRCWRPPARRWRAGRCGSLTCSSAFDRIAMASTPWQPRWWLPQGRTVLGCPKRCKLAHAFLREYSCKRLKLAQLLGQLGVFFTSAARSSRRRSQSRRPCSSSPT